MGIEQFDYLYQQSQIILGLFSSLGTGLTAINTESEAIAGKLATITANLSEIDTNLTSISTAITAQEYETANTLINSTKTLAGSAATEAGYVQSIPTTVTTSQEALASALTIINSLIPLITDEISRIAGDGNTHYIYRCSACSLACKKDMKFVPADEKVLSTCELDGKKTASFVQTEIITEN